MRLFRKREDQDEKLIRNMKRHDEKEKAKQHESKIHGQKQVKENRGNKKTRVHNS